MYNFEKTACLSDNKLLLHLMSVKFDEDSCRFSCRLIDDWRWQKLKKLYLFYALTIRETREGWPLLFVETEENGGLWSRNERGPSLVGSLGSLCRYKRFLFCLGCSISSVQNIFFLAAHFFSLYVSHLPSKLDRQSCRVACLISCVSAHNACHRVHTEWRLPISGVHPFMIENTEYTE